MRKEFKELRSKCQTKAQKLAFNKLVRSFATQDTAIKEIFKWIKDSEITEIKVSDWNKDKTIDTFKSAITSKINWERWVDADSRDSVGYAYGTVDNVKVGAYWYGSLINESDIPVILVSDKEFSKLSKYIYIK